MKHLAIITLSLLVVFSCFANTDQGYSFHFINTDTTKISHKWLCSDYWKKPVLLLDDKVRKQRTNWVAAGNIAAYTGALGGLYTFWYRNYAQSSFHFFNDIPENLQVDKVSHAYGAYMEGRLSIEMWRWTGMSNRKAVMIGGLSGLAYEGIIETLDGFSSAWGWSWGDIGGNVVGTSILLSQELAWHEQRISYKYSTHINSYQGMDTAITHYMDKHSGTSFVQRMMEDYNAQTYWLSFNIKSFIPNANVPAWLNMAVGYGADGMFGPRYNIPAAKNIERYRQWYLAPDIDFTRIKTRNPYVKYALIALNCFKFPTPSLELSQGKMKWNWLHF